MNPPLYVEVSPLLSPTLTGVGRFVARLVEALSRRTDLCLVSTISRDGTLDGKLSTDLLCGHELRVPARGLPPLDVDLPGWVRGLLRRPKRAHDAGLAGRCPGLYTWLRPGRRHFRRELAILYDFTPVVVPWAHVRDTRDDFGKFFETTSGLCDGAVAISRSTRADARWLCALPPEDVVVGYPGPSLCVHAHADPRPVTRRDDVILVVATREPRKNGLFLLRWFLDTAALDPGAQLWWVGPRGWWSSEAWPSGRRGRSRLVRFLGMVSDRALCRLYRQAAFSIYPSLYEGFGFPVLDALRHGTPVLSGFNSSLQEFAGPGVFYFDPCDPASLDDACRDLLAALRGPLPPCFDRDDLDRRFSWDALAQTVLALCARHRTGSRVRCCDEGSDDANGLLRPES
jgi:glycosyltransferase involved in cell wall biosynthesis